jgi:hypothetical protein
VSVVPHRPAGAAVFNEVSTSMDDSGDDLRESPSSPYNKTRCPSYKKILQISVNLFL